MAKNVDTVPFLVEQDLEFINQWLGARGLEALSADGVPRIGLLARCKGIPVAAVFLRQCETDVGMVDGLVTDPKAEASVRHEALDLLVDRILVIAHALGISKIFSFTKEECVLERSLKHGFKKTEYRVISRIR